MGGFLLPDEDDSDWADSPVCTCEHRRIEHDLGGECMRCYCEMFRKEDDG